MKTITVRIPDDVTETEAQASIARLFNPDWLASWWSIEDVQGERPHLTDDQAREVLTVIDRRHDASIGINWDFIQDIADSLFDEPEDLIECEDD
jgi:hypothetical protein